MNTQSYGWRSIRLRLFLLFALVIAAVLFYAVSEVMTQWNTRGAMERGAQYSELSVQINGVVHELQKERGLSAGLIGSRGARFKGELDTQHQDTDKARAALDAWLAGADREQLDGAIEKALAPLLDGTAREALAARAADLRTKLEAFDQRLLAVGTKLAQRPLLGSHPVYQYLARRYQLNLREVHWEPEFDIICSVVSSREHQLERMMTTRGMSREEAEARIAAQMPAEEKAA